METISADVTMRIHLFFKNRRLNPKVPPKDISPFLILSFPVGGAAVFVGVNLSFRLTRRIFSFLSNSALMKSISSFETMWFSG